MQRHEYQHNTREQVVGYIGAALEVVAELDPPEDLRGIVLAKAIDLLAAKQLVLEQPQLGALPFAGLPR